MKLILARHGYTTANKRGVYSGWVNHRLTKEGILQAERLGKHLKNEIIHGVYSSDLSRAKNTAKAILKYHPHLKLGIMKELREGHNGKLESKLKSKYNHMTGDELSNLYGFEKETIILKRANKALSELYKKHEKDTVLVVAHGWFNRIMTLAILKKPISEVRQMKTMPNTGYSIFEIGAKKSKAIILNESKHVLYLSKKNLKKYLNK